MFGIKTEYAACAVLVLVGAGVLAIVGCNTDGHTAGPDTQTAMGVVGSDDELFVESPGARLWAQNCIRCHNIRTPASLSDRQWQIVMHHMRVRANLTGEQHESILRFLQAAN